MEPDKIIVTEPQPNVIRQIITEPITRSTKASSTIHVTRKRGKIYVKDGKELARKNGSMKNWLLPKTNPLQLSSVQEEDVAMEVD